ncbi:MULTISPECIES: phenylacetate--CoA ligase family protein [unclassified Rhodococcus (in: high G+C Gram-positive bacteria)]|nr:MULTISPECIES: phenylacetate--CoA ligase family protein [unclassified Rhodococcus (in: high G+C Gram-positive bacteria)]KJF19151.1 Phenylacetate-coenzyme A ligase [Rhodococcus sp. AD45]
MTSNLIGTAATSTQQLSMEEWSFPTRYNNDYLPNTDSRYWFRHRETMDPQQRAEAVLIRLREVMRYAYRTSDFYRRKWDGAGISPEDITSFEAFESVPVVTKAELRQSQLDSPPYGNYLCAPESEIHHIHGSSGTTGTPTAFAVSRQDWDTVANNHARVMWGMGLRPGDTVFIAAVFSLYLGSWGALAGAERLRCRAFPFGAGAPGMTARAVRWLKASKPKGFYATPSYALRLAEVAVQEGIDPKEFGIKVMFFSGEPGASIPSVRTAIESAFGARVVDCGTMAEMTPFMSASATAETPDGMLLYQDIVHHEVCDPTNYRPVPYGGEGTAVYTHLERTSQPMIRLASGDLTSWVYEENPCGRTYPKLPRGIYGRIDDMIHIRGENVYPTEIENVLRNVEHYGGEHRIIVSRTGSMDEMLVKVECKHDATEPTAIERFEAVVSAELQATLGLRVSVETVSTNTFDRTDHKARRVEDRRALV